MLTSIFVAVAQNVLLGWLWRRLQELVAWTAGLAPLFLALTPEHQALIVAVLQGQGGGYSISAYAGLAMYLWSQWQSFRATVRPQVVTTEGRKLPLTPVGSKEAEAIAKLAPKRQTLWERLSAR
jgi:hypothetical protein